MYIYKATAIKVVDGDTIDCEIDLGFHIKVVKRVRLAGIDTPELNSEDVLVREDAIAAKKYVAGWLGAVPFCIKTELDRSDKYGRVLGWIYPLSAVDLDSDGVEDPDQSLNNVMVEAGHAQWYGKKGEK